MCSSIAQACGTHHDPGTPLFSSESVLTRCVRQPRHPLCASLPSDQVSPCDTWLTRCNVAPHLAGLASPCATDRSCSSARRYARWHTHCTLARSTCCTPPAQPCVLADRAAGGPCPGRRPQSTRGGATHASQEARPRASRTLSPRTTRCARRRPCAQGLCRAWERRACLTPAVGLCPHSEHGAGTPERAGFHACRPAQDTARASCAVPRP